MRMAIGKRLFKKYVEKFTKMKLLIKVAKCDGNIDFGIDTTLYEKLVRTLDSFKSTMLARQFCDEMILHIFYFLRQFCSFFVQFFGFDFVLLVEQNLAPRLLGSRFRV